jgi:hypothetical protein
MSLTGDSTSLIDDSTSLTGDPRPLFGNYTSKNVPSHILDMVVLKNKINVDVLSMGAMAGTGLDDDQAEDKGMIKNHWMWRVIVTKENILGQVLFGFSLPPASSIGSNEAQYARSSDRGFSSDSSDAGLDCTQSLDSGKSRRFSGVSDNKPPAVSSSEGHGPNDAQADVVISSSHGDIIQQPVDWPSEGAPVPGEIRISVRPRIDASYYHRFTRSFTLEPGTTFGQLLKSMTSRGMEGFHFRKLDTTYLGCRDGMCVLYYYFSHAILLIILRCFSFHPAPRPPWRGWKTAT